MKTSFSALETLSAVLKIENDLGRVRLEKWGERLIDIDIIFFNNDIIETPELCIPHKHMHERNFVLVPMHEIAQILCILNIIRLFLNCFMLRKILKRYSYMKYKYIAIEGNIGSGKTTLATMLSKDYDIRLILESFAENPFLPKFYENTR